MKSHQPSAISYQLLAISRPTFPTAYCLLPTAYCLLLTALCLMFPAQARQPAARHRQVAYVNVSALLPLHPAWKAVQKFEGITHHPSAISHQLPSIELDAIALTPFVPKPSPPPNAPPLSALAASESYVRERLIKNALKRSELLANYVYRKSLEQLQQRLAERRVEIERLAQEFAYQVALLQSWERAKLRVRLAAEEFLKEEEAARLKQRLDELNKELAQAKEQKQDEFNEEVKHLRDEGQKHIGKEREELEEALRSAVEQMFAQGEDEWKWLDLQEAWRLSSQEVRKSESQTPRLPDSQTLRLSDSQTPRLPDSQTLMEEVLIRSITRFARTYALQHGYSEVTTVPAKGAVDITERVRQAFASYVRRGGL